MQESKPLLCGSVLHSMHKYNQVLNITHNYKLLFLSHFHHIFIGSIDQQTTVQPHQLKNLEDEDMNSNYQEFQVKWLNYIVKYSKEFEI